MVTRGHQSHKTWGETGVRVESLRPRRGTPPKKLEQTRSAKTGDRIGHRQRFPLKEPAGHRESQSREANVKDFHKSHPLNAAVVYQPQRGSNWRHVIADSPEGQ